MKTYQSPADFWNPIGQPQPASWAEADKKWVITTEIIKARFGRQTVATAKATAARNWDHFVRAESKAETESARMFARSQARKWESVYEWLHELGDDTILA